MVAVAAAALAAGRRRVAGARRGRTSRSRDVIDALTGQAEPGPLREIVLQLRLPRTRRRRCSSARRSASPARCCRARSANPLASPDVIGVTGGAGFGAMLILLAFPGSIALLPVGALAFGLLAAALVFAIAWRGRNRGGVGRLILAGIAIAALFTAGTTSMLTAYPDRVPVGDLLPRGRADLGRLDAARGRLAVLRGRASCSRCC